MSEHRKCWADGCYVRSPCPYHGTLYPEELADPARGEDGEAIRAQADLSTQHQPTETIMDSSGRIHMMEEEIAAASEAQVERLAKMERALRHTGFVTRDPMPEKCDARRVLGALDRIAEAWPGNEQVPESAAALAPLTPFERGYVLGVLSEYRAWRATR